MKTFKIHFILAAFILLSLVSCSKKDGGVSVSTGKMKATFDKVTVNMNLTSVVKFEKADTVSIVVEGMKADSSETLGFMFLDIVNLQRGKYDFDTARLSLVEAYYDVKEAENTTYCDGVKSKGSITVITYDSLQFGCSFSFDIRNPNDTSMVNLMLNL
jgi:hypothetical protein